MEYREYIATRDASTISINDMNTSFSNVNQNVWKILLQKKIPSLRRRNSFSLKERPIFLYYLEKALLELRGHFLIRTYVRDRVR